MIELFYHFFGCVIFSGWDWYPEPIQRRLERLVDSAFSDSFDFNFRPRSYISSYHTPSCSRPATQVNVYYLCTSKICCRLKLNLCDKIYWTVELELIWWSSENSTHTLIVILNFRVNGCILSLSMNNRSLKTECVSPQKSVTISLFKCMIVYMYMYVFDFMVISVLTTIFDCQYPENVMYTTVSDWTPLPSSY